MIGSELTLEEPTTFDSEAIIKLEAEMLNACQAILNNEQLHNDICHRKAVKVAKLLVNSLDPEKYQVSLVQITDHSAVLIRSLSMANVTDINSGARLLINSGFPLEELPQDYYFLPPGSNIANLLPTEINWIESRVLRSPSDADGALAWSVSEAKKNKEYYPTEQI